MENAPPLQWPGAGTSPTALAAVRDEPPTAVARGVLLAVVALVALLLLWAALGQVDIVASAEGRLIPRGYSKVVQPAQGGVVNKILVKEGETVREGQVLLTLDARLADADTQASSRELALQRLSFRRIEAELADHAFLPPSDESIELVAQVQAQWRARRQTLSDALAQEAESLNRARADLQAAEQTQTKLAQTLPLVRQSAEAYRRLVAEGFVGELAAADRQREAIEKAHDLDAQAAHVLSLRAAVAQAAARGLNVRSHYRSQLEGERIETTRAINRHSQDLDKARLRAAQLEIRAPHDGVVKDLTVRTVGAVVESGAVLLGVVPAGEPLQAEVAVHNADAGFVAVGQVVQLKVAAYPFQKHGLIEGRITLLSADASAPQNNEPQMPTYRALVTIDSAQMRHAAPSGSMSLSAGMAVTAEVHQGRRSVLEYLLSPIKKVAQEAARER